MACEAGTLLFLHHGVWHGGGVNLSDRTRTMFKIRMRASGPQSRRWTFPISKPRRGGGRSSSSSLGRRRAASRPSSPPPNRVRAGHRPPRIRQPHQALALPHRRSHLRRRLLAHPPGERRGLSATYFMTYRAQSLPYPSSRPQRLGAESRDPGDGGWWRFLVAFAAAQVVINPWIPGLRVVKRPFARETSRLWGGQERAMEILTPRLRLRRARMDDLGPCTRC